MECFKDTISCIQDGRGGDSPGARADADACVCVCVSVCVCGAEDCGGGRGPRLQCFC